MPPSLEKRSIERERVSRAAVRAEIVKEQALADILAAHAQPGAGTHGSGWLGELQALIDGASPDEVKALRRALFDRPTENAGRTASTPTSNSPPAGARAATRTRT